MAFNSIHLDVSPQALRRACSAGEPHPFFLDVFHAAEGPHCARWTGCGQRPQCSWHTARQVRALSELSTSSQEDRYPNRLSEGPGEELLGKLRDHMLLMKTEVTPFACVSRPHAGAALSWLPQCRPRGRCALSWEAVLGVRRAETGTHVLGETEASPEYSASFQATEVVTHTSSHRIAFGKAAAPKTTRPGKFTDFKQPSEKGVLGAGNGNEIMT